MSDQYKYQVNFPVQDYEPSPGTIITSRKPSKKDEIDAVIHEFVGKLKSLGVEEIDYKCFRNSSGY